MVSPFLRKQNKSIENFVESEINQNVGLKAVIDDSNQITRLTINRDDIDENTLEDYRNFLNEHGVFKINVNLNNYLEYVKNEYEEARITFAEYDDINEAIAMALDRMPKNEENTTTTARPTTIAGAPISTAPRFLSRTINSIITDTMNGIRQFSNDTGMLIINENIEDETIISFYISNAIFTNDNIDNLFNLFNRFSENIPIENIKNIIKSLNSESDNSKILISNLIGICIKLNSIVSLSEIIIVYLNRIKENRFYTEQQQTTQSPSQNIRGVYIKDYYSSDEYIRMSQIRRDIESHTLLTTLQYLNSIVQIKCGGPPLTILIDVTIKIIPYFKSLNNLDNGNNSVEIGFQILEEIGRFSLSLISTKECVFRTTSMNFITFEPDLCEDSQPESCDNGCEECSGNPCPQCAGCDECPTNPAAPPCPTNPPAPHVRNVTTYKNETIVISVILCVVLIGLFIAYQQGKIKIN
tara:strand:+ start:105 stop:1511 length:1407 start_codon:yes stop_codon:yes gene_type:complete